MTERPMFDDESLPEWLVAGGITYAGQYAKKGSAQAADAELPPWERPQQRLAVPLPDFAPLSDDTPPPWASVMQLPDLPTFEQSAESVPPAFQPEQLTSESIESVALDDIAVPWAAESRVSESAATDDPFGDLDWLRESPASAPTGQPSAPTFQTSWLSEATLTESAPSAAEQAAMPTFQTDWLSETSASTSRQDEELSELFATTFAESDDWLRSVETASESDLSAFGSDATVESAPTLITSPRSVQQAESSASADLFTADSADWLRDFSVGDELGAELSAEQAPAQTQTVSDWFTEPVFPEMPAFDQTASSVPEWLSEASFSETSAFDQAASSASGWLAEPSQTESVQPVQAADDLPDWLSAGADTGTAEAAQIDDVPEWLRTSYLESPQETLSASSEPELQANADLPDWMRDLAPEPKPSQGLIGSVTDEDMAWLDQFDFKASAAPQVADIPKPSRDVPRRTDFETELSDPALDAILAQTPDFDLSEPSLPPINLDEEFDFETLPELPPTPVVPEPPVPVQMPAAPVPLSKATGEAAVVAGDLPDWVAEMRPDSKPTLRIGDQEITLEELPLAALPEPMLALRERIKQLPKPPEVPEKQDSPLSGIPEALQLPDFAAVPTALVTSGALATAAQLAGVQTLRRIVAAQEEILKRRETVEISAPAHVKPRARFKLDRLLLVILLIAAVILPFFTDLADLVPAPRLAALDRASQARFTAINDTILRIPSGATVLVAFEYTLGAAAEMDDLARALLRDLFRRGARPVIVSTNPASSLHAYNLLYRLSRDTAEMAMLGRNQPLLPRRDYIVLGYLPGGVSGVRALANALYGDVFQQQVIFGSDLEGAPSGISAEQLLIMRTQPTFLLAQSQENVQTWVEQLRPPPNAPSGTMLRLIIATTSAATATAQTYAAADPQRVIGTLSGLRDALLYRELRAQYKSAEAQNIAERRWQSVGFAAFAATLAILVGAALSMIQYLAQRRRSR